VRKDIDDLRQEMSKKGKKRVYKDEAGVSYAQIKYGECLFRSTE
jgi:hypothetical protein